MKRIISIISIILIIAAVGVGVYFGWQKSKEILTPPGTDLQPTTDDQQQPPLTTSKPKLKIISEQPAFDYWTAVSGDIFYISQEGKIFQIADLRGLNADQRGKDELISDRNVDNLIDVKANKDGTMLIVKYGDFNAPRLEIFEVDKAIWQPLADNITAADFSPDSSKIIYAEKKDNGVSDLIFKDLNSAKPKTSKIMSLSYLPYDLAWIDANNILLTSAPSTGYVGEIWQLDLKTKAIKLFVNGFGLTLKWLAESNSGLLFNSAKNQISLIDINGAKKANIEILTLPDKCFMNSAMIYCAVIQNYLNTLPKPALPDDYLKKAFYSQDKIYAIDMADNSSEIILSDELPPAIDAVNLLVVDNNLLFINRYDNKVYSLAL